VSLPSEKEKELRQIILMERFLVKTRTALINRLHAAVCAGWGNGVKEERTGRPESRERLKEKFMALSGRMSKTKNAVAIGQRMVELMRVLAKQSRLYADASLPENWPESSGTTN
jgi:hypothetical protein